MVKKQLPLLWITIVLFVTTLIIPISACGNTPVSMESRIYRIAPGDQEQVLVDLKKNERLDLTVDVEVPGGTINTNDPEITEDIGISALSPDGKEIIEYMKFGFGEFMILAESEGEYTITLDNSFSQVQEKSVTVKFKYSR